MRTESEILLFFIVFIVFLGFINPYFPTAWQFITSFDLIVFGGGIIGVAGACVITTGIPCAIALTIFGVLNIINSFIIDIPSLLWVKVLVFLPLTIITIYIISRLARGGG